MNFRRVSEQFAFGMEDLILVFIILLNILDFFEIIPDYLDYIKKIIEWSVLGYLLYKVSLAKLFFGKKSPKLDILLIFGYIFLMFKSIIGWANSSIADSTTPVIREILGYIVSHQSALTYGTFVLGSIILICSALYAAVSFQFKSPSVISIFHSIGYPKKSLPDYAVRFIKAFLILIAFFVIVFNLLFEWLAIAVDAPLAIIALFVYILFFVRHKSKFHPESFLYKIGDFGESFYENVIRHFIYKDTLLLGISGMLVLHLLADFGNYILPYIIQLRDVYYYYALEIPHETIYLLISRDILGKTAADAFLVISTYLLNLIAIVMLLVIPAVLWYYIYSDRIIRVKRWHLCIFFLSLPALILMPSFGIVSLTAADMVGVDIIPHSIFLSQYPLEWLVCIAALLGVASLALSVYTSIKKTLAVLMIAFSQLFFGYYLYQYFSTVLTYHAELITNFISGQQVFLAVMFIILLLVQIFFYVGGFIIFEYEIIKKLKKYVEF
ncbi:MAG: hypothetical protein V1743_04995 [Nanoarchaeota archaeon]